MTTPRSTCGLPRREPSAADPYGLSALPSRRSKARLWLAMVGAIALVVLHDAWVLANVNHTNHLHILHDHSNFVIMSAVFFILVGLVAFHFFQLSKRRQKDEAISRAIQSRLTAVLTALPDAAFVVDEDGRVLEVLSDASHLFRLPDTMQWEHDTTPLGQGRYLEEILPMECATMLGSASRTAMASRQVQEVEFSIGAEWYEARISRVDNAVSSTRDEAVCLVRDITARKRMERSIQEATVQAEAMNLQLQQLDQIKSDLLSAVSHEIRTPLTSIFGFVVLVRKEFLKRLQPVLQEITAQKDPESAAALQNTTGRMLENLRIVQEEGARLGRLVDDLLDLSRIEAGKSEWRDESINIVEVIDRSVASLASRFAAREHVKLHVDVAPGLPMLFADKDRLQQVIVNLLDNALKFTETGDIHLTARRTATDKLELSVEDSGAGIPPEELDHIFEKFHQSRSSDPDTQRIGKGSGLGLAICRNIILHYGGDIRAVSPPRPESPGARFIVELPPAPFAPTVTRAT